MILDSEMIGHKFNKLTPIKRVEDQISKSTGQHHPTYECVCECGNHKIVRGSNLIHGAVKSCGCTRKESIKKRAFEQCNKLVGERFSRLVVLEWLGTDKNNQSRYRCKCDCGNETIVYRSSLIDGDTKSCGCYAREVASGVATQTGHNNAADLVGYKTGKLTVIERLYSKNNNIIWKVRCDCGSEIELSSARLLSGGVQSCGCLISKGEEEIAKYLIDHNVDFEKQKSFDGCKDERCLPFDFWIGSKNTAIEFDGEQHYKDNAFFHHTLEYVQKHDKIKNDYCESNNINLIRIPYTDIDKIDQYLCNVC